MDKSFEDHSQEDGKGLNPFKINLSNVKERDEYMSQGGHSAKGKSGTKKKMNSHRDNNSSKMYESHIMAGGPLTARSNNEGKKNYRKNPYDEVQRLNGSISGSQRYNAGGRRPHDQMYLDENSMTLADLSLIDNNLYLGQIGTKKLDKLDADALKWWHKHTQKRKKKGKNV